MRDDRHRSNLWIVHHDGSDLRPLTSGNNSDSSPRWSPDGKRLLYVSTSDGSAQLYVRWMDSGLKIRKVDAALVRIPDASHGMAGRPSHLIGKVAHILKWFETHRTDVTK